MKKSVETEDLNMNLLVNNLLSRSVSSMVKRTARQMLAYIKT